ncbi:MAG: peptidoglycan DD-metalloendopeptidase family protein, partial [Burkholderiales bacterium]
PALVQPVQPAPGLAPGQYVVKRGDTLYSIALEHGVDYRDIALRNRLDDPTRIRIGQVLHIPSPQERPEVQVGTARAPGAIEARPIGPSDPGAPQQPAAAESGTKTAPKALRLPYSEQNLALLSKGEALAAAKPAPQPVAVAPRPEPPKPADRDPDAIEFIWPAKGRLLAGFSEPHNKGVDIAGTPGDPVIAAAPGRVMYTGTGIRGYGKLIVIKHDNGFNSVYAHNREILVKEGQNVARGQRIAELGATDADAPKLHFEIRKSGKPVDPLRYLPPS